MSALVEWFNVFVSKFISFCNSVVSVLSYIWSLLKTLWFWLTSLLSWVWDLVVQLFNWTIFNYVGSAFSSISYYIWTPAVIFMSSLFLVIILRIAIAFVFKILRLNIDYHNTYENTRTLWQHGKLKK